MTIFGKTLEIPSGSKTLKAAELWEVRWTSRNGEYSSSIKPEAEVFPSPTDAEEFAAALRAAFKLLKYSSNAVVKVTVNKR